MDPAVIVNQVESDVVVHAQPADVKTFTDPDPAAALKEAELADNE